jgi:high frequency lysogenization protein
VIDVFGGVPGVKLGLANLSTMLANRQADENRDMVRYVFAILYLERKFAADSAMMSVVHSRLEHASFRADHFANHVNDLCHSVSGIYQDTLSKLSFRIKVNGSAQHLQNTQNADIIRALLLAGLRAAFLWRQLGGRRWKLLLQRKQLLQASQQLSRGLGVV